MLKSANSPKPINFFYKNKKVNRYKGRNKDPNLLSLKLLPKTYLIQLSKHEWLSGVKSAKLSLIKWMSKPTKLFKLEN